jgi:hypothetical protein
VSAHERERLSAYLDDELPPAERAAVELHLAACAECRGRLSELAAVDEAAAGLPADAPDGYFDGFARRVRERLEQRPAAHTKPAAGVRVGRRLPSWTWAVAAALLLAVVTPLTWRERNAERRTERTNTPGAAGAPTPARELAANTALEAAPASSLETRLDAREGRAAAPAAVPTPRIQAAARSDAPRRQAENVSPGVAAPAAPVPAPVPVDAPAPAAMATPAQGAGPAKRAAPQLALEEKAEAADAAAPAMAASAMAAAPGREAGGGQATDAVAGGREAAALGRAKAAAPASVEPEASPSVEFRRLASESAVRVEQWRSLRERWRLFAAGHSDDARADEARVRVIACGLEAVRTGGGEADRATLARDADAYFARTDARQRARVRALVEAAASR